MKAIRLLATIALSYLAAISSAFAVGTLIPAPDRVDVVHDFARDLVYITSGGSVLRYDIATGKFLSPIVLGGVLMGMDIAPYGGVLAVADATHSETEVWIHVVNLQDLTHRKLVAPRSFYEGGTFTVAFGDTGWILSSSRFEGSGWTPLRRFAPGDGQVVELGTVTQDVMLAPSGDRTRLAYAEANISDGRWGRYTFANDLIERREGYEDGTSWFNFEIATNRTGSRFAIPTYGGTIFYNGAFEQVGTVGTYATSLPIGVAWHPVEDRAYFPWWPTSQVKVYDTQTLTEVGSYDFETTFDWIGNHAFDQGRTRLSVDGSLLMVTVDGGVRFHRMYAPLDAADLGVTTLAGNPVEVALAGSIGNSGTLAYSIVQQPAHGQVTLAGTQARYAPAAGFKGQDKFTYRVVYGLAAVEADVVVDVETHPPVAVNMQYTMMEDTARPIAIVLKATDADGDPLTYEIVSTPQHGTLTGSGASRSYRPAPNFSGVDTFTYLARDATRASNLATVTLNVTAVNDPPVAMPDVASVARRGTVTIPVLGNDSDPDGDTLTIVSVTKPASGSAKIVNGAILYNAGPSSGTAKFSYTISDGHGRTATAMVTVTILR